MLIFERSQSPRQAKAQAPGPIDSPYSVPKQWRRESAPRLPACSELEVVRHFSRLSTKNPSIEINELYALGSCTLKYNPYGTDAAASLPGFLNRHPLALEEDSQG